MNELPESSLTKLAEENSQDIHEFFLASKLEIEKVKKRKKQFTISLVVLCSFSLMGFVFVFLLWRNSEKLQDQIENTSKANAIATKAYTLLEHDPTLAFRLAEESYKIDPTPLNKQVIMAAYAQVPFYQKLEVAKNGSCRPVIYSPNGKYILTGTQSDNPILWDKNGNKIIELLGHKGGQINSSSAIAFSSDNKLIATASTDSTARLWNLKGDCLAILKHNGPVNSVSFSPDDQKILTASSDKTARLWDLEGKELVKMEHEGTVRKAIFYPNGLKIVTASKSDNTIIWDLNGNKFNSFKCGSRNINISRDGKFLVSGGLDKVFRIFNIENKKEKLIKEINYATGNERCIGIGNSSFITCSDDLEAYVWDFTGKNVSILRGHSSGIWSAQFSPNGNQIITASDDGTARLWDLEGNEIMLLKGHTSQVFSAQFSPDGKQIVTASGDKTARIWTIEPEENPILKGHKGYVYDANFSPDGKRIITAGWDYSARLWTSNGTPISAFYGHTSYGVSNVFFYKADFISIGSDGFLRFWNDSAKEIQKMESGGGYNYSCSLNFDSTLFAINANDNGISKIMNNKGKTIQIFDNSFGLRFLFKPMEFISFNIDSSFNFWNQRNQNDSIWFEKSIHCKLPNISFYSAEFSPDGKWMTTITTDSTILIWEMKEIFLMDKQRNDNKTLELGPEKIKQKIKFKTIVSSVVFSPKKNIFISNSEDNILRLWNMKAELLAEFLGHSDGINDVNFSPDGELIITGSSDKSVRIWDLTGKEIMCYPGHSGLVTKAKFSPNGRYILSGSYDHTARLMPVTIKQVLSKINKEKVRGDVYKLSEKELKVYGVK